MRYEPLISKLGLPFAAMILAASVSASAPKSGDQETFATPRAACQALLTAAEAHDEATLGKIFGPQGDEILRSGDAVEDRQAGTRFVMRAKQSMREKIDPRSPTRARVLIGADNFPFPIPLVKSAGRWRFDTPAGKKEVLARRIGANELDAIAATNAFVDAQYDYASEDRNKNGVPEYARKLISSEGKKDGLFWPGEGAPPTEFSAMASRADVQGYRKEGDKPTPYRGYYYRILMAQGPNVRGGALDYVQGGSMIGGFALVAWPAEYGVSGIKTFVVNQDGVIREKDLGPTTSTTVEKMAAYNPDKTWQLVH